MAVIISLIIAYLLGSVSTSILLSKIMKFPDPRAAGSGNAGATNILRLVGKKQAIIVMIGDGLKGLIAVWIGMLLGVHGAMLGFVGLLAVVGHIYPVYFKFKGGKGVATSLGAILGLSFIAGLLAIIIWAGVAYFTRYSSLASLVSLVAGLILILLFATKYAFPVFLIVLLVAWKHMDNIKRLRTGTETKVQL